MQKEAGRSLTEVLGILAIMGILSLGGLGMYHSAINSHRANELIYEANKRATVVAAQIMAGRDMDQLSVDEFTNSDRYTFGVERNSKNSNQFNITVNGVDTDVCQQIKNTIGSASVVRVISEFCDKLTFNNDLSTTNYPTDFDTNKNGCTDAHYTWCSKGDNILVPKCSATDDCCTGVTYDTQCQSCDSTTGEITNESTSCTYTFSDNSTQASICDAGICLDPTINPGTTKTPCLTNDDCGGKGSGYYCKYSSWSSRCTEDGTEAMGCSDGNVATCEKNGVCTKIGTIRRGNVAGLGQVISSSGTMYWWSAKNWCEAQNKKMVDVEQLQAYRSNGTLLKTKSNSGAFACVKGKTCSNWGGEYPAHVMWKANSGADARVLTNAKDANGEFYREQYSPIAIGLRQSFGPCYLWTASAVSADLCKAFVMALADAEVRVYYHDGDSYRSYALCQ